MQPDKHDPNYGTYVINYPCPSRSLSRIAPVLRREELTMETPVEGQGVANVRDYLAEERTFLAWIRTSLALMGFGFVVTAFRPLLGRDSGCAGGFHGDAQPPLRLVWNDVYHCRGGPESLVDPAPSRLVGELDRGQSAVRRPSRQGVLLALFLALVGVAMAFYLISA